MLLSRPRHALVNPSLPAPGAGQRRQLRNPRWVGDGSLVAAGTGALLRWPRCQRRSSDRLQVSPRLETDRIRYSAIARKQSATHQMRHPAPFGAVIVRATGAFHHGTASQDRLPERRHQRSGLPILAVVPAKSSNARANHPQARGTGRHSLFQRDASYRRSPAASL